MPIMSYLLANHLQEALIVHLLVRDEFAVTQHSPLLNGRKVATADTTATGITVRNKAGTTRKSRKPVSLLAMV